MVAISVLRFATLALTLSHVYAILPIATPQCLAFAPGSDTVTLLAAGASQSSVGLPQILTSASDWGGVQRAAGDLALDFQRTTGVKIPIMNFTVPSSSTVGPTPLAQTSGTAIIVGTIGMSPIIDALVSSGKISTSAVQGQWESFLMQHVSAPFPGITDALVIAGADKRGSIFGIYTLSEQLGVSPWWFWTDTASTQRTNGVHIITNADCSAPSPTIQYRGIFLNDEQPALTNWANEKLRPANSTLPTFRANFYVSIFELLLRLKANYLWPAQWSSMFAVDDPNNQFLADWYGVVMGTSHEEPMMRSTPNEWNNFGIGAYDFNVNSQNLEAYWTVGAERAKGKESLFTMGMRGNGDLPLGPTTNIALLESIIAAQRNILQEVYNLTDQTQIAQMWCLYKEVQLYYNAGLRVPDDITLLWTDDNWGHIQRLPSDSERNRWGGAGVYFHADYVGDPRDYKWINTVNNVQIFQQLALAYEYNATRIWILNSGDLKGLEVPVDFFLSMAYNASAFTPTNIVDYQTRWAEREFGSTTLAPQIAEIVMNFTRFQARRKPELLAPNTFTFVNYNEAENVASQWQTVLSAASSVAAQLPAAAQSAFFETVWHPVNASANLNMLYLAAGRNNLWNSRASSAANLYDTQVQDAFMVDWALKNQYHTMLGGKWDHMMDQTHLGYYYWQQPMADTLPPTARVLTMSPALAGSMRLSVEGSLGAWPGDDMNNCAQQYSCPDPVLNFLTTFGPTTRYVDIASSGPVTFTWNTTLSQDWLMVSQATGTVSSGALPTRVLISVNWTAFPQDNAMHMGVVRFESTTGESTGVTIPVIRQAAPPSGFHGFVEGDGVVSMEAEHFTSSNSVNGVSYSVIPSFGTRVFSGVTTQPGLSGNFTAGSGPSMSFSFYTFNTLQGGQPATLNVTSFVFSSFNQLDYGPLLFGLTIDSMPMQTVQPVPNLPSGQYVPADWDGLNGAAANAIRTPVTLFANVSAGAHTLTVSMITPAVVFEKFIIDVGGLQPSYLGPPESSMV